MNTLTDIQARVLGCLMEKKESTPDQYPLTLNALRNACNQKTSRYPVVSYSEGEVGHALRELENMELVRENWGARVARYEHLGNKALNLYSQGIALVCTLLLRGPQTLGELKSHSQRLFAFDDLDDVQFALSHLLERDPPLATALPRQPGQKEERYAHLLCGDPDIPEAPQRVVAVTGSGLGERVAELESRLEEISERLRNVEESLNS